MKAWDFGTRLFHFYLIINQTHMKTQQTTISEVRLVYRTKVKASDRPQVKCSKDAFDIFMEDWDLDIINSPKTWQEPGKKQKPLIEFS